VSQPPLSGEFLFFFLSKRKKPGFLCALIKESPAVGAEWIIDGLSFFYREKVVRPDS